MSSVRTKTSDLLQPGFHFLLRHGNRANDILLHILSSINRLDHSLKGSETPPWAAVKEEVIAVRMCAWPNLRICSEQPMNSGKNH